MTARYAVLVSEFHLTMGEIYKLTPRQINDVYFHPREKDGSMKLPDQTQPLSDEGKLLKLLSLAPLLGLKPEEVEKLNAKLEAIRGQSK